MVPKASQNGAQNALFGDLSGHWASTPVFIRFSVGFGSFLRGPNLESVWQVQCLLKITTFRKRSVFELKHHTKSSLFGAKTMPKAIKNVAQKRPGFWAVFLPPFGSILEAFWHPWGTLLASKSDHCDLLVPILGLWPPKVVPGPLFRYPPPSILA